MKQREATERASKSLEARIQFDLVSAEKGKRLTMTVSDPDYRSQSGFHPFWKFYLEQTTAEDLVDLAGILLDLAEGGQMMTAPEPPRERFIRLKDWLKKRDGKGRG